MNLVGIAKDDKVSIDEVKYIIPSKRCAKLCKENLSSEISHLATMENHQKKIKGNCPKWPKVRNRISHERIYIQHKVYQHSSNTSHPVGRHKVGHASERNPP